MKLLSINRLAEITGVDRRTVKKRLDAQNVPSIPGAGGAILYHSTLALPVVMEAPLAVTLNSAILTLRWAMAGRTAEQDSGADDQPSDQFPTQ